MQNIEVSIIVDENGSLNEVKSKVGDDVVFQIFSSKSKLFLRLCIDLSTYWCWLQSSLDQIRKLDWKFKKWFCYVHTLLNQSSWKRWYLDFIEVLISNQQLVCRVKFLNYIVNNKFLVVQSFFNLIMVRLVLELNINFRSL